jgi:hypothetical protein
VRIPVYFGTRFYGHLQQEDGSAIATRCFHLYFLPVIPLGTYRVYGERGGPEKFSFKSLFAAFFKSWGFAAAVGLAALSLTSSWAYHPGLAAYAVVSLVLFAAVYASWLFLGHRYRPGESRPRKFVVPIMFVLTLATIGYGATQQLADAVRSKATQAFNNGPVPPADAPFSMATIEKMAGAQAKNEYVSVDSDISLKSGDMVEIAVPGGFAFGMVESDYGNTVRIKTMKGSGSYSVDREALTLVRPKN